MTYYVVSWYFSEDDLEDELGIAHVLDQMYCLKKYGDLKSNHMEFLCGEKIPPNDGKSLILSMKSLCEDDDNMCPECFTRLIERERSN